MTNEELCAKIQSGSVEAVAELWEQVKPFCYKQAKRLHRAMSDSGAAYTCGGAELDDLLSSSFLAVHDAAHTYDASHEAHFLTWLSYYLKTEFSACYGWRTSYRDALDFSKSLDTPLDSDDADGATLADLVPDKRDDIAAVTENIYRQQLRKALDDVLNTLPPEAASNIRNVYFDGQTVQQIADRNGTSSQVENAKLSKGMSALRRTVTSKPEGRLIRAFVEERTPYYFHVGVSSFNSTRTSAVEKIVFIRDDLEREAHRRMGTENALAEYPNGGD